MLDFGSEGKCSEIGKQKWGPTDVVRRREVWFV